LKQAKGAAADRADSEEIAGDGRPRSKMTTSALHPVTDLGASVIDKAKRGDQQAFTALIKHYDHGLRALAYRLLGDADRMEDALQEAYVRMFRGLPSFRGDSRLGTWLYRIVYNVCLDELDRAGRLVQLPFEDTVDPPDTRPDIVETIAHRSGLARALATLPPEERAAVLLVDAQGFDYRGAGEVLGVPAGTIASRLNRARAALRQALEEHEEGVSGR
jgi:RNA polymerase sigma-70 factor, ECF subfamily